MGGEDHAGGFVAEDVVAFDDHGADAAGVPEVDVGAGGGGWLVGVGIGWLGMKRKSVGGIVVGGEVEGCLLLKGGRGKRAD